MTQIELDLMQGREFKEGSQNQRILEYLKAGRSLTPLDAFQLFGTLALHSRAAELREAGWNVRCEKVRTNGKTVGRYSL